MVAVIRVEPKPEPVPKFDQEVRKPGMKWLAASGFDLNAPVPEGEELPPYWRACLDELHADYSGLCAYLSVFIERVTGGLSVDHFVAKSKKLGQAYEWSNYRLASTMMNARKRDYDDVLDPFTIPADTFHLELVTGRIFANPDLSPAERSLAEATLARLGLDEPGPREMRARHYQEYREGLYTADYLRRRSPFVWSEAKRQRIL